MDMNIILSILLTLLLCAQLPGVEPWWNRLDNAEAKTTTEWWEKLPAKPRHREDEKTMLAGSERSSDRFGESTSAQVCWPPEFTPSPSPIGAMLQIPLVNLNVGDDLGLSQQNDLDPFFEEHQDFDVEVIGSEAHAHFHRTTTIEKTETVKAVRHSLFVRILDELWARFKMGLVHQDSAASISPIKTTIPVMNHYRKNLFKMRGRNFKLRRPDR